MGGEGGGVLTGWIVSAARASGLVVQATSVPGVAQRTGGTTYYIEMASREPYGRAPVLALTPVPGQIDVVLASELAEGARAARTGFVTPDRTTLISSSHRVFLIQEKMAMGDGRIDPAALEAVARRRAQRTVLLDMKALADNAGVPISPVLLGALAGAAALPIDRAPFEDAVRASGIAVDKNLAAFTAALTAVTAHPPALPPYGDQSPVTTPAPATARFEPADFISPRDLDTHSTEPGGLPDAARDVVAHALQRLEDYQDAEYAAHYRRRLEPFVHGDPELLREVARHLALRMSYEDVIRVAQLKARGSRYQRIAREVGARSEDPFDVQDFFKPGVREMADILPPTLARFLLRRAERSEPLARLHVGMKVRTTTITGYLRVWTLARLRPWRRRTHRWQTEQAAIDAWLALVERAAARGDRALAREIVDLARLIKGYGDTHQRGTRNYRRIVSALVEPALARAVVPADTAHAVSAAREAALADPEGKTLDATLPAVALPVEATR
jgi:indolepyruvate ferredoxin oxidoreductase beta subunit